MVLQMVTDPVGWPQSPQMWLLQRAKVYQDAKGDGVPGGDKVGVVVAEHVQQREVGLAELAEGEHVRYRHAQRHLQRYAQRILRGPFVGNNPTRINEGLSETTRPYSQNFAQTVSASV